MKKLKQILATIGAFFQNIFDKEFHFLKQNSHIAVTVTNGLKAFIESPVSGLITSLIPGDADDIVRAKLQIILPKVANTVAIAHGIILQSNKHSDMLAAIVEHVKTLTPDARALFWIHFSGLVNHALADGKISFGEAVTLAQYVFAEQKRN